MLDDNDISDWRSLRPLYTLSSLRCLSLSDNSIERIPAEELSPGTSSLEATAPLWQHADGIQRLPWTGQIGQIPGQTGQEKSSTCTRLF